MIRLQVFCSRFNWLIFTILFLSLNSGLHAAIPVLEFRQVADSEETFDRRIYSYDMGIDTSGGVHLVYLKPSVGNSAQVIYSKRISGSWSDQILTSSGLKDSISTRLLMDENNTVHICYIKDDANLYYVKIVNNSPENERLVSPGGWHTRMQLDDNNRPVFIREGEDWQANPKESKLVIVTTTDGQAWTESFLDLPAVNKFRIGEFVYANGSYHITYGDYGVVKPVLTGKGSSTYTNGVFHNLYYAVSGDGTTWNSTLVDNSLTLYEYEFWTTLQLDGSTPLISMYSYAEYDNQYNTGTSLQLITNIAGGWDKKNITSADYSATREGMGVGMAVNGTGDYFGAWDFSPDNTYNDDFRGERGNIALARSDTDDSWGRKWQLAPFSAEGEVKIRRGNNRLHVLALGDYIDTKLYYWEIDLGTLNAEISQTPSPPVSGDTKAALPSMFMLLQ